MLLARLQGFGPNDGVIQQIDPTYDAARVTLRPPDWQLDGQSNVGGHFRLSSTFSSTANKPTGAADMFSARWTDSSRIAVIKAIYASALCTTAHTAAQAMILNLYKATAFTVSPSAGTALVGTPLSTLKMGNSLFGAIQISSGDAVTAGTRTLAASPIGSLPLVLSATANVLQLARTALFEAKGVYDHPLILNQNEGIVVQWDRANAQAAGVTAFTIDMDWIETPNF